MAGLTPSIATLATDALASHDGAASQSDGPAPRPDMTTVIDRYEAPLLRYAVSLVGGSTEDDAAQDIVQDALLALHRQWQHGGQDGIDHLPTWLYRVVRNRAMDVLRRRAVRRRFTLQLKQRARRAQAAAPTDTVSAGSERRETIDQVRQALKAMPARSRELLRLRTEHDLSLRQIARVLNQPHATVAHQFSRALQDLARRLNERDVI